MTATDVPDQIPQPASNPYESLVANDLAQNPAPPVIANPYEELVKQDLEQQQKSMRAQFMGNYQQAIKSNPDVVAEARQIAAKIGGNPVALEDNIDVARELAQIKAVRYEEMRRKYPVLMRELDNTSFVRLAHDDLDNLRETDSIFSSIGRNFTIGQAQNERGYIGFRMANGMATEADRARLAEIDRDLELSPGKHSWIASASSVVGQMSTTLPQALATGAAAATLATMAGPAAPVTVPTAFTYGTGTAIFSQTAMIEAGSSYLDMIAKGIDPKTARFASLGVGALNGALELVGTKFVAAPFRAAAGKMMAKEGAALLAKQTAGAAGGTFIKDYAKSVGGEVVTEMLQEVSSMVGEGAARRISRPDLPEMTWSEIGGRVGDIAAQTFKGMALLGLPGAAINLGVDLRKAHDAVQRQQVIEKLVVGAEESKVLPRDPVAYEAYVKKAAEANGAPNFYVDGRVLADALRQADLAEEPLSGEAIGPGKATKQFAELLPEVAAQVREAEITGADVVIPTEKFLAQLAKTEFGKALAPHLRMNEGDLSFAEAERIIKEQPKLVEEAVKQAEAAATNAEDFQKSAKVVEDTIYEQIVATKTRSPSDARLEAKLQRAFVSAQAIQEGVTPEEFYAKHPLSVVAGTDQASPQQLDQLKTDSPEFANWFQGSKVVDAQGKPLVVYHGTKANYNFTEFDGGVGSRTDEGWLGRGFYFTTNKDTADWYAGMPRGESSSSGAWETAGSGSGRIGAFMLSMKNPLVITPVGMGWLKQVEVRKALGLPRSTNPDEVASALRSKGHDGVILDYSKTGGLGNERELLVLDPTQIKSVNNRGTFDPNDPNILHQTFVPEQDLIDRAVAEFGITKDPREAGYILPDGRMLKFGEDGQRIKDHRSISRIGGLASGYSDGMIDFMNRTGAVRFDLASGLVETQRIPNTTQLTVAVRAARSEGVDIVVQASRPNGDQKGDAVFEKPTVAKLAKFFEQQAGGKEFFAPGQRGGFVPASLKILLNPNADSSTFIHELSHSFLTITERMAETSPKAAQDFQTILDWFGVKDMASWKAMTLDEQRKHHEAWAYNWEVYAAEGKAPSMALQSLFEQFRLWLLRVYRSIRDELSAIYKAEFGTELPGLTKEVRQVMDGMLASEDAITHAEQVRSMSMSFLSKADSKLTDAEWQQLLDADKAAHGAAVAELNKKTMANLSWLRSQSAKLEAKVRKERDAMRKKVRDDVADAVEQEPVYKAMRWLRTGETVDAEGNITKLPGNHRLQTEAVLAMLPTGTDPKVFGDGRKSMIAADGMQPDTVAEMLGFTSGEALVKAIVQAPDMQETIDAATDRRMVQEHGELADPEQVKLAIEKALHNEFRARAIATRIAVLSKGGTARMTQKAAQEAAKIALASKLVRQIRPDQFAAAEARAARQVEQLMKKGDMEGALAAMQAEMMQHALARESLDAKEEIDKAKKDFAKVFGQDEKLAKQRNLDLVMAARHILSLYQLGEDNTPAATWTEQLREYNPELFAEVEPFIRRAGEKARSYQDLTLDEFRQLADVIEALWEQSRRQHQIEVNGKRVAVAQIATQAIARLEAIGVPNVLPGEKAKQTAMDENARDLMGGMATTTRLEHLFTYLDGGKAGIFTNAIWRRVKDALTSYRTETTERIKRYDALVAGLNLKPGKIDAQRFIGYTFGSKSDLIGALLHTGNLSNKFKLIAGRKWGEILEPGNVDTSKFDAMVDEFVANGTLTQADFDFCQAVWDLCEEMFPAAQRTQMEVSGFYSKQIPATPFMRFGKEYRGGYVPAKADSFMHQKARMQDAMAELKGDMRQSLPVVPHGAMKARVETFARPLTLSLQRMTGHIDEQVRYTHVQPAIADVMRLLNNRELKDTLERFNPTLLDKTIMPWLIRAARGVTNEPGKSRLMDRAWSAIRRNTGLAFMMGNVSNALQNVTGLFTALVKVKPKHIGAALMTYMGSPRETTAKVSALSKFMADRLSKQVFELMDNIGQMERGTGKAAKAVQWTRKHAYFLQKMTQNPVDIITWLGAYNQAMEEIGSAADDADAQKEAVSRADATVRMTQGSMDAEDVSAFEVGTPFFKAITQFAGWFNNWGNLNVYETKRIATELGWQGKGQFFGVYAYGIMLPMVVASVIGMMMAGKGIDDEDDDGYLDDVSKWFFGAQLKGAAAAVPVVGPLAVAAGNFWFDDKSFNDRIAVMPVVSGIESGLKSLRGIFEKDISGREVRDVLTFISMLSGAMVAPLGRPIGYAMDVQSGRAQPSGPIDFARGLVTGAAGSKPK